MKKLIRASKANRDYYVVHFGWDEGGPESGPIFKSDNIVIKARNEKDAENRVINKLHGELDGCWAEPATQQDIDAFVADMEEAEDEYQNLVDVGLIDPELDKQMAEDLSPDRFKKMTMSELHKYYKDFVEGYEFNTFSDWYEFLKGNGSR